MRHNPQSDTSLYPTNGASPTPSARSNSGYYKIKVQTGADIVGKQTRELLGQRDITMSEAAQIIGRVIGKTDLRYVHAPNEQLRPALIQLGMSPNMADLLLEMSGSLN